MTLRNGDVLSGELARQDEAALIITHPVLGELTVPRADVRAIAIGETAVAKKVAKAEEKPVVRAHDDGLLGSGWLKDWDRRHEAGVSGSAGASNNQQGHVVV